MSSNIKGLHNLDYVTRYEQVLAENLPENFMQFADFFSGTQRLHTLGSICATHVTRKGLTILNVGSGPFATEIFVEALQDQTVVALDYTPEFEPFHALFQQEGYLEGTSFLRSDVMTEEFDEAQFDLIILHDILYEQALDMEAVISRLSLFLKPGGMVFFDFVNTRTAWIWRMLGKPNRFRRYDPRRVKSFLSRSGFEIMEWRPTHGAKNPVVRMMHATLRLFGVSNNYAVLVLYKGK